MQFTYSKSVWDSKSDTSSKVYSGGGGGGGEERIAWELTVISVKNWGLKWKESTKVDRLPINKLSITGERREIQINMIE